MTSVIDQFQFNDYSIEQDIQLHPGWIGLVSGLAAEKMLRGCKTPYRYVIRQGECVGAYYITFMHTDGVVRHQPFTVTVKPEGWYFEQGGGGGPFVEATIDDVVHLIIHCQKNECTPLVR